MCSPHQASAKGLHGPAALVLFFRCHHPDRSLTVGNYCVFALTSCHSRKLGRFRSAAGARTGRCALCGAHPRCSPSRRMRKKERSADRSVLRGPCSPAPAGWRSKRMGCARSKVRFRSMDEGGHGKPQYRSSRHTTCPLVRRVRVAGQHVLCAPGIHRWAAAPFTVPSQPASFTVRSRPHQRSKSSRL